MEVYFCCTLLVLTQNILYFISDSIKQVNEITGKTIPTFVLDIQDKQGLQELFSKVSIHVA